MKKSVKRLVASAFVLFVAVCMVVTTAYAWFSMSNNPSAGEFELSVTTSDGLFISASGIDGTYKTKITGEEIFDTYQAIPQLGAVTYAKYKATSEGSFGENNQFLDLTGAPVVNGGFTKTSSYVVGKNYYEEAATVTDITRYVTADNFNLFKNCNIALYAAPASITTRTGIITSGEGANAKVMTAFADKAGTYSNIYTATKKVDKTGDDLKTHVTDAGNTVYRFDAKYFEFNLYFLASSPFTVYANISKSICDNKVAETDTSITGTKWEATLDYADYLLDKNGDTAGTGSDWNTVESPAVVDADVNRTLKAYAEDAVKIGFFNTADSIEKIWEPDKALTKTGGAAENTIANLAVLGGAYRDYKTFKQHSDFVQDGVDENTNIAIKYYNDINNLTDANDKIARLSANWAFPDTNGVYLDTANSQNVALMEVATLAGSGNVFKSTVTLKIWMDGWDADCFDTVLQQVFKTQLEFYAK